MDDSKINELQCLECGFVAAGPRYLKIHSKIHEKVVFPLNCDFCDHKSHTRKEYYLHKKNHKIAKEHHKQCTICEKKVVQSPNSVSDTILAESAALGRSANFGQT